MLGESLVAASRPSSGELSFHHFLLTCKALLESKNLNFREPNSLLNRHEV